jgi:amino acid transporter
MEEKAPGTPVRLVGRMVVGSLLAAAVYYALASVLTGMTVPWQTLIGKDMVTAAGLREAYGNEFFARLVLIAGLCGIVTVGNGAALAASRLLFALSRARLIALPFDRIHPKYGSPVTALLFVTGFGLVGNFLGRNGITPIVNVGSTCSALAYLITCLGVLKLRRSQPERHRPYRIPLGRVVATLGALASAFLLGSSLYAQYAGAAGFPLEWSVLLVWAGFGWVLWRQSQARRNETTEVERRRIVLGAGAS